MTQILADETPKATLLHQAFLERASDTSRPGSGDLGLGAFLTLRMVDQFRADASPNLEALKYQVRATQDFVDGLSGDSPEVTHLRQVARVGDVVLRKAEARLLWSPLLAYAFWLEQQLQLAQALDVLDTSLALAIQPESGDHVNAHLQRARVLRQMSRYEESTRAYETGGAMAARLGDRHSELRSRIGRGIVAQKVGNLSGAETILREAAVDAHEASDREAEASAYHDLANVLELMGRIDEGVLAVFKAYELYEQRPQQIAALQVVGVLMKGIGNYRAAEDAFSVVLASGPTPELRINTMLELLHVASLTGDRVAFERWRKELENHRPTMPPDACVDFDTKVGQGYTFFGQAVRAREALEAAVRRAEQHGLNKYLFRAEEALRSVGEVPAKREGARRVSSAHLFEVDEVAEKLQLLRAAS